MKPLRVGSFCSGIAAPETAWQSLGWEPAFFSEIDPFASAVLSHRYPGVPNLGDMEAISAETLRRYPVDVVVAGTPCQSFSVAGLRGGMADPRGNLALVLLRLVDQLRPLWLVWENVPGILSSDNGRDFGSFLGALGQLGYGWAYRVLDAQHFGVPQRRRRVFVVGHSGDWRRAAAVLFDRHSLSGNPAPSRKPGETVAGTLKACAGKSGRPNGAEEADRLILSVDEYNASLGDTAATMAGGGRSNRVGAVMQPIPFDTTQVTSAGNYSNPKTGDPCHPLAKEQHAPAIVYITPRIARNSHTSNQVGIKIDGLSDALSTDCRDSTVAYTIHGTNKTARVASEAEVSTAVRCRAMGQQENSSTTVARNGMAVRRLLPIECERLQGFPDDWTNIPYRGKPATDGPRYRAIGNSMAVPVLKWVGERIDKVRAEPLISAGGAA